MTKESYYEIASMELIEMLRDRGVEYRYGDEAIKNIIKIISQTAIKLLSAGGYNIDECCKNIDREIPQRLNYNEIDGLIQQESRYIQVTKESFDKADKDERQHILERNPDYINDFLIFKKPQQPNTAPLPRRINNTPELRNTDPLPLREPNRLQK